MAQDRSVAVERMKPLPYYRWYVQDYRASRNANRLSWQERGIYRELLDECWVEGSIPDDIERLADICRCPVGPMAEAWPTLRRLFAPLEGLDGMYLSSKRLEIERSEEDKERIRKANAGRKGGLAKAAKLKQNLAEPSSASGPLASSSSSEQLEQSKSIDAPAAASPNGGPSAAACPWCHSEVGHAAGCRPVRLSQP